MSAALRPDQNLVMQVLPSTEFNKLAAMQPGELNTRASRDVNAQPEPSCDWQRYSAQYPQDPNYMVVYYHNRWENGHVVEGWVLSHKKLASVG